MHDLHIHTSYSPDSDTHFERYIELAIENGYETVGFADHSDTLVSGLSFMSYIRDIDVLKKKYAGQIVVLKGLELDARQIDQFDQSAARSLDFTLLSFHDFRNDIPAYYASMLKTLRSFEGFTTLAHIDFPMRYIKTIGFELFAGSMTIVSEILSLLIARRQGLELNFGFAERSDYMKLVWNTYIVSYLEKGGKKICIGSDAHNEADFLSSARAVKKFADELAPEYREILLRGML